MEPWQIVTLSTLSAEGTLRVDLTIGVGYGEDIKKTKEVLLKVLTAHPKVLSEPLPTVNVSELADSSVNFAVRPWSTVEDYWTVYFESHRKLQRGIGCCGYRNSLSTCGRNSQKRISLIFWKEWR